MGAGRKVACALVALSWVAVFVTVWRAPGVHQFDFKTYYCAARAYEQGLDPYQIANIRMVGGNPHLLGFYYPLSALHLLRPVAALDYVAAHRVWLVLKALAVAALLLVWKRAFLPRVSLPVLLAAGLFAFHAATLWDIKTGNITVFEQLWLWAGLACLAASRPTAFVACVVVASTAKLLPALFLLLLFLPALRSRANALRFAAGAAAVAAVALLPFAADPDYFAGFVRGLTSQHPPLKVNPSILGLADGLAAYDATRFAGTGAGKWALVALYYALLFVTGRPLLARLKDRATPLRVAILVAALCYALLVPRLIVYSLMIAIVPALALLLPAAGASRLGQAALVAALGVSGLAVLPGEAGKFALDATPLLVLWGAWAALVWSAKTGRLAESP